MTEFRFKSKYAPLLTYLGLFLVLAVTSLSLVENLVSRDQWRFLEFVSAYFDGTLSFDQLWSTHSDQNKLGYKVFFLLNAVFLDLNLWVEHFVGLLMLGVAGFLIVRRVHLDSLSEVQSFKWLLFFTLPLSMQLLSYGQIANLTYSLLSFGGYFGLLLFVLLWLRIDDFIKRPVAYYGMMIVFLFILTSLTFSGARYLPFFAANFVGILIVSFLSKDNQSDYWKLAGWLLLALIITQSLYWWGRDAGRTSGVAANLITMFIADPLGFFQFLLVALGRSWVMNTGIQKVGLQNILLIGVGTFLFYMFAIYLYFKKHMWHQTRVPLFLILYAVVYICAVYATRYEQFALSGANMPRYVFDTQMGLVGCLWIYVAFLAQHAAGESKGLCYRVVMVVLAVSLVVQVYNAGRFMSAYPFIKKAQLSAVETILTLDSHIAAGKKVPGWLCPSERRCVKQRDFLKENSLNVFDK